MAKAERLEDLMTKRHIVQDAAAHMNRRDASVIAALSNAGKGGKHENRKTCAICTN